MNHSSEKRDNYEKKGLLKKRQNRKEKEERNENAWNEQIATTKNIGHFSGF